MYKKVIINSVILKCVADDAMPRMADAPAPYPYELVLAVVPAGSRTRVVESGTGHQLEYPTVLPRATNGDPGNSNCNEED